MDRTALRPGLCCRTFLIQVPCFVAPAYNEQHSLNSRIMYSKDLLDYIEEHSGDDPQRLLLSTNKNSSLDIRLAVSTIISRQKMKFKNPEWSSAKGLVFPNVITTEQS